MGYCGDVLRPECYKPSSAHALYWVEAEELLWIPKLRTQAIWQPRLRLSKSQIHQKTPVGQSSHINRRLDSGSCRNILATIVNAFTLTVRERSDHQQRTYVVLTTFLTFFMFMS